MKVFLLPQNYASDLSHKVRALRSLGIDARGLAIGGHAVQTAESISLVPQVKGEPLRNRLRRIEFAKHVYEGLKWADVIHWMSGFGRVPFRLDAAMARLAAKPGVVQWAGSDIR